MKAENAKTVTKIEIKRMKSYHGELGHAHFNGEVGGTVKARSMNCWRREIKREGDQQPQESDMYLLL